MVKKIACVGYHATGAGVIDDLFREFDNVAQGQYEVECRVLQDPDGISDLEYNLVENPHRLNSGFAIKRFLKYVKRTQRTYKKIFGDQWMSVSKKYAESIAKIHYNGYWHGDIWLLNPIFQYYFMFRRGLSKIAPKKFKKKSYYNYFPWLYTYHAMETEDDFLQKTRDYMEALCDSMNSKNKEFVLLDQLYAPGNIARYERYIRDTKTIIVDRDPRDVYIFQQIIGEHTLPKNPKEFCIVYRDSRIKFSEADSKNTLYVTFEDLIYHYDECVNKVIEFVGIDKKHWTSPKSHFDPQISIKNTKLWEKTDKYKEEIKIIEKELADMLIDSPEK